MLKNKLFSKKKYFFLFNLNLNLIKKFFYFYIKIILLYINQDKKIYIHLY
jgi:hypothetical protein